MPKKKFIKSKICQNLKKYQKQRKVINSKICQKSKKYQKQRKVKIEDVKNQKISKNKEKS